MTIVGNLKVGEPDTWPSAPSHIKGVPEGNQPHPLRPRGGRRPPQLIVRMDASRSTGINPERRNPIDPRSPNLSPA